MGSPYKSFGIYRITNITNGKTYVGKTAVNFGDRWDCHRAQLNGGYHDNRHLQNAWKKYGPSAFEFSVIETVADASHLDDLEKKYIQMYKEAGLSYNISPGGDGGANLGRHLSEETKRRIGEKNRVNMRGRQASADTRKKMSESQKKRYAAWSDADRSKWGAMTSEKASGYHWSESAKAKFSESQRAKPNSAKFTPEQIRSIRDKCNSGSSLRELAEEYNTSESYISAIVHRRRWKDI